MPTDDTPRDSRPLPLLLTAAQAAELLQIPRIRAYELARTGILPCVRIGRNIRFERRAIMEWIRGGGTAPERK